MTLKKIELKNVCILLDSRVLEHRFFLAAPRRSDGRRESIRLSSQPSPLASASPHTTPRTNAMAAPLAPLTAAAVLRLGSRGLRHRHRHRILLASLRPCSSAPQPHRSAIPAAAARRLPTPPPPAPRRLARTLAASAATVVSKGQTE